MAVLSTAITVTTSATRLDSAVQSNNGSEIITLYNDGAVTVYVGGPAATASGATKGVPLTPGQYWELPPLWSGDAVYGITASSTASVLVKEVGV